MLRRTAIALPAGEASAGVRVFPGCGPTLAACLKNAPGGTTVRLRTNADVPIPDELTCGLDVCLTDPGDVRSSCS